MEITVDRRGIKLYYFTIKEASEYLNVPRRWIEQHLEDLPDVTDLDGVTHFSPDAYGILRRLRDETH